MPRLFHHTKFIIIGVSVKQYQIIVKNISREEGTVLSIDDIASSFSIDTGECGDIISSTNSSAPLINKRDHLGNPKNKIVDSFIQSCSGNSSNKFNLNTNDRKCEDHYDSRSLAIINFLNKECQYILCEKKNISPTYLSTFLRCSLHHIQWLVVPIIHMSWLTSSLSKKQKLDISNYLVSVDDESNEKGSGSLNDSANHEKENPLTATTSNIDDTSVTSGHIETNTTTTTMLSTSQISSNSNHCLPMPTHQLRLHRFNTNRVIVAAGDDTDKRVDVRAAMELCRYKHVPMLSFDYLACIRQTFLRDTSSDIVTISHDANSNNNNSNNSSSNSNNGDNSNCKKTLDHYFNSTSSMTTASERKLNTYMTGTWYEHHNMLLRLSPLRLSMLHSSISDTTDTAVQCESLSQCQQWSMEYIGFDLDGTVIKTKSNNKFPKDINDWTFWNNSSLQSRQAQPVLEKLKDILTRQKLNILIISNQNGVSKGFLTKDALKGKIDSIVKQIYRYVYKNDISEDDEGSRAATEGHGCIDVVCSVSVGLSRKPCTGCYDWVRLIREEQMKQELACRSTNSNNISSVSVTMSLYVGDAAGRVAETTSDTTDMASSSSSSSKASTNKNKVKTVAGQRAKDFGDSDLKFALNVGCDVSSRCSNSNSSSSNNRSSSNDDADDETHAKSIWWYNHRLIISIIYISVMVLNDSFISLYWSTYLIVRYVCILYMSM